MPPKFYCPVCGQVNDSKSVRTPFTFLIDCCTRCKHSIRIEQLGNKYHPTIGEVGSSWEKNG